jgi:4,5-DOPA dioxygenase extradiol
MPVVYVSHGAPLYLPGNEVRRAALGAWALRLPRPRAIVVMTPHFASRGLQVGITRRGFAWYDLPAGMKRLLPQDLEYATPPSTDLAARVEALLGAPVHRDEERRGFDHTTWMPLKTMFPAAAAPVLEIAYPYVDEEATFRFGQKLAPLRDEGVLFVASGGMTHNLAMPFTGPVLSFAVEFDAWAAEALARQDLDALLDWRGRAPASRLAHPDDGGHFRVLFAALGVAAGTSGGAGATFPITGFESALSLRSVELT